MALMLESQMERIQTMVDLGRVTEAYITNTINYIIRITITRITHIAVFYILIVNHRSIICYRWFLILLFD